MGCAGSAHSVKPSGEGGKVKIQNVGGEGDDNQGKGTYQQIPITEKYTFGKKLGSGSFASCAVGTHKESGEKFAIKTLLKSHENYDRELLDHEVRIMIAVEHPRCIKLVEVFEDKKAVHLVEELAVGGELFDRIVDLGHFSEQDGLKLCKQILEGIAHMHSVGACHRDLKPENLLMVSDNPSKPEYMHLKIADFGLSSLRPVMNDQSMNTVCGTPDYLAPEIVHIASQGRGTRVTYDSKVDVWATGVILYTMLAGYPPFYSENLAELLSLIKKGEVKFPKDPWKNVSKETRQYVAHLLTVDQKKRPTSMECLKHPRMEDIESVSNEDLGQGKVLKEYVKARRARKVLNGVKVIARLSLMHQQQNTDATSSDKSAETIPSPTSEEQAE